MNDELRLAAEAFLEGDGGCQIDMTKREVRWLLDEKENNAKRYEKKQNKTKIALRVRDKIAALYYTWLRWQ